jgi:phage tail sheath protein FI
VPVPLTYPGVYIQELPNPIRPIVGVPTSVAAFVGLAPRGQVDFPFQVNSWSDFENEFGPLDPTVPLSYAVYLFFLNGGSTALVVRNSDPNDTTASVQLSADITLNASSPGAWGTSLTATVDTNNLIDPNANQFNLTITETGGSTETYPGASLNKGTPQYLPTLLAASQLVAPAPGNGYTQEPKVGSTAFAAPAAPAAAAKPAAGNQPAAGAAAGNQPAAGAGAAAPAAPAAAPPPPLPLGDPDQKTGIYALTKAEIFNILCLPVAPAQTYDPASILEPAIAFCLEQRAVLIVDPPSNWNNVVPLNFPTVTGQGTAALVTNSPNAAVYYPNLVVTDATGANFHIGPCGAVAGVWASTDSNRGVWKAPAGTAATITGIAGLSAQVDDGESGVLNPLAVNALRTMPEVGPVLWGARTTVGADQVQSQWKYLPVRRLALFIEESLRRGTQWAVFEPNDEPLWSSLRLNVTAFMQGLFQQGAFQGSTPAEAYLVQCDANNNPQNQIDLGIVNILVGFAPLYPAEFVIINIQQQAGQA